MNFVTMNPNLKYFFFWGGGGGREGGGARVSVVFFTKSPNKRKIIFFFGGGGGWGCRWTNRRAFTFFDVAGITMNKCAGYGMPCMMLIQRTVLEI